MLLALSEPMLLTVSVYVIGLDVVTFAGPALLTVKSASGPFGTPVTSTEEVAEAVNVVADFVPEAVAVLLMVVPLDEVTTPRMVTVQVAPPASVPPLQVTR